MKKHNFCFLIIFLSYNLRAQSILKRDTINETIIAGWHQVTEYTDAQNPDTGEKYNLTYLYIEPFVGYFFNKNFGIGIRGEYGIIRSNYYPNMDTYGIGTFARYYYPFKINKKFFNRLKLSSEITFSKINYNDYSKNEFLSISSGLNYSYLSIIPAEIQFRVFKNLYVAFSTEYFLFVEGRDFWGRRGGIEYHFN